MGNFILSALGFPFAKILNKFCKRRHKILLTLLYIFPQKNINCPIPLLRNSILINFSGQTSLLNVYIAFLECICLGLHELSR